MQVFHEAMNISRDKRAGRIELDNSYAGQFYRMLLDHSAGCVICLIWHKQHVPWHDIMSCPAMQSVNKSQYGLMRVNIKHVILPKLAKSVCWICHVPQLNHTVHPQYLKANRECRFRDRLTGLMYMMWAEREHRRVIEEFVGLEWNKIEEYGKWMCKVPSSEEHGTNMVKVF